MNSILPKIYKYIVWLIALIIVTFLIAISFTSTCYMIAHYSEVTFFVGDSVIKNVIILALFILVIYLCSKIKAIKSLVNSINNNTKVFTIVKYVLFAVTLAICVIWVISAQLTPNADAFSIQHAVDSFSHGDNGDFVLYGYLSRYPHQIGFFLISYLLSLIFGIHNYVAIGIINSVCVAIIYKALADISGECGMSRFKQIVIQLLGIIFIPTILYSSFIYGNLIGLAFILLSFKYEIKYFNKEHKKVNCILSFVFMCIGLLAKSNYLICLIASIIYAIVKTVEQKRIKSILIVLLFILSYVLTSVVPIQILEKTTGGNLHTPVQTSSVIAMGLQEGTKAPGWHNGYNQDIYYQNNADIEQIKAIDNQYIKDRLSYFLEHKGYAFKFFTQKAASQWNNPSFQSLWINQAQGTTENTQSYVLEILSVENTHLITTILKPFLFLTYVGLFLYLLLCVKKSSFIDMSLLLISFVGTFIFLLIFEAKCESSMMFFVMLFPMAIEGFASAIKSTLIDFKKIYVILPIVICLLLIMVFNTSWAKEFLSKDNEAYSNYLRWPEATFEQYK